LWYPFFQGIGSNPLFAVSRGPRWNDLWI